MTFIDLAPLDENCETRIVILFRLTVTCHVHVPPVCTVSSLLAFLHASAGLELLFLTVVTITAYKMVYVKFSHSQ